MARILPAIAALVCVLGLATGCASSPGALVTGKARVDVPLSPGEARRVALEAARRDAYSQILEMARDETVAGGSIGAMMKESPYVASRVRRAIQQSKVYRSRFYDDGNAVVVLELDLERIRAAAIGARGELR